MTRIRPARAEEMLLAMEREQTLAEIRAAASRLPVHAAAAVNPVGWLRRYPVATSAVAALGAAALVARLFAMRRESESRARPTGKHGTGQYWTWASSVCQELLGFVRRGLLTAASARLLMGSAPSAEAAEPGFESVPS